MTLGFYGLGYEWVNREAGVPFTPYTVLFGSVTGSSVSTMGIALVFLDVVEMGAL